MYYFLLLIDAVDQMKSGEATFLINKVITVDSLISQKVLETPILICLDFI